ncbi:MAG: PQQ-dependent sugar dehydrogenase [Chitinophagales bacterium]
MKSYFTLCALALTVSFCAAQTVIPELELEDFAEGFNHPLDIQNCGDSRLFIVEQPGKIWIVDENGNKSAEPFIDLTSRVKYDGAEQGLLGLAFHPDYATNGYFYVNYITLEGNTRIARFQVMPNDPNKADPLSQKILLKVKQPFANHNGGCLRFGADGYLYIGLGDGGDAGDPFVNAQNPAELLGKMLRIDVNSETAYKIPPSNPFVNVAGYAPEIWALGLRNPFRWSFDRLTNDLWIADVGQDKWEEVNYQPAASNGGENYGWDCKEGKHKFEPANCDQSDVLTAPIYNYKHQNGDCTVIGGFVYRGSQFPNLYGKYVYNDYCSGMFRVLYQENNEWLSADVLQEGAFEYVTFGEDIHGELYSADIEGGEIFHVIDVSPMKTGIASSQDALSLYPNPTSGQFTVNWNALNSSNCTIEIINVMGQKMLEETRLANKGINTWTFSTSTLSTGSYMMVIHTDSEKLLMKKFIVE